MVVRAFTTRAEPGHHRATRIRKSPASYPFFLVGKGGFEPPTSTSRSSFAWLSELGVCEDDQCYATETVSTLLGRLRLSSKLDRAITGPRASGLRVALEGSWKSLVVAEPGQATMASRDPQLPPQAASRRLRFMRRPWISMRLALAAGILLATQVAFGSPSGARNVGSQVFDGSSLTQSLGSAVVARSSDFGAKLLPARGDPQSASSATRAIALLVAAVVVAAIRFLFLAAGTAGWKRRFLVAGRGAPTRAPPGLQLA